MLATPFHYPYFLVSVNSSNAPRGPPAAKIMTGQADGCPNKHKRRWTKTLTANILAIARMITIMTTSYINEHSVNAQMMGDHLS